VAVNPGEGSKGQRGSAEKAAARQVIGKRRTTSRVQARGVLRRQKLVDAGLELLRSVPVEELTFRQVCAQAEMPEGSAYHFYANKYDLLTALAGTLSQRFIEAHREPIPAHRTRTWADLADLIVERGAEVYAANPAAVQLCLGARTPPEVKLQDRINDREVSAAIQALFRAHFSLPPLPGDCDIFFHFIEITDLFFSLSVLSDGRITPAMLEEAKRAGRAYLGIYLPPALPIRAAQGGQAQ
jgi:AcrR family transcriptional regulator